MKNIIIITAFSLILAGCATNGDQMYYDTVRSVSKDNTVAQSACWAAVGEIAKGSDSTVKATAIALAERCKNDSIKIKPPIRNWLGF